MKNNIALSACLMVSTMLILPLGCKGGPGPAPGSNSYDTYIAGRWEGKDQSGAVFTFWFGKDLRWESQVEENGATRPHYRGTYSVQGAKVTMKVTHEADLKSKTFKWIKERGNMPYSLTGNLSGTTLKLDNVLTKAELRK